MISTSPLFQSKIDPEERFILLLKQVLKTHAQEINSQETLIKSLELRIEMLENPVIVEG